MLPTRESRFGQSGDSFTTLPCRNLTIVAELVNAGRKVSHLGRLQWLTFRTSATRGTTRTVIHLLVTLGSSTFTQNAIIPD